jgi:hypothetical protein
MLNLFKINCNRHFARLTCIFSRILSPLHDGGQLLGVQLRLEIVGDDGRVEAQSPGIRFDAAEQRVGSGRRVGSLEVDAVGLWINIFEKF